MAETLAAVPLTSLSAGIAIGAASGYLGSLMLGRRMALIAGPLGHLTLPGVALALVLGFDVSVGAFPIVILGAALIWWLELRTSLPVESLTAVVFAAGVALTFLILPVQQAEAALVGDIMRVGAAEAGTTVLICGVLMLVVRWQSRTIVLISVSEDLAASTGVNVRRHNLGYLVLIAIVVALGVKVVGGLLIAALVAIPAATARNVAHELHGYVRAATLIGAASATIGILLATMTAAPAGPLIVVVAAASFVVSVARTRQGARAGRSGSHRQGFSR